MLKLLLSGLLFSCLLCTVVWSQSVCVKRDACSCVNGNNQVVDLSPLAFNNGTPRWSQLWDTYYTSRYSFNPCFNFTESNCTDVSVCRFNGAEYTSLGSQQSTIFVTDVTNGHLTIIYNTTDNLNVTRITQVELVCIYEGPDTLSVTGEVDPVHFSLRLRSPHCCPKSQNEAKSPRFREVGARRPRW